MKNEYDTVGEFKEEVIDNKGKLITNGAKESKGAELKGERKKETVRKGGGKEGSKEEQAAYQFELLEEHPCECVRGNLLY